MKKKLEILLLSSTILAGCSAGNTESTEIEGSSGTEVEQVVATEASESEYTEINTHEEDENVLETSEVVAEDDDQFGDYLFMKSEALLYSPYYDAVMEQYDEELWNSQVEDTKQNAGIYTISVADEDAEGFYQKKKSILQVNEDGTFTNYDFKLVDSEYNLDGEEFTYQYRYIDDDLKIHQLTGPQPNKHIEVSSGILTQTYGELNFEVVESEDFWVNINENGEYVFTDLDNIDYATGDSSFHSAITDTTLDTDLSEYSKITEDQIDYTFAQPFDGKILSVYQIIDKIKDDSIKRSELKAELPLNTEVYEYTEYYFHPNEAYKDLTDFGYNVTNITTNTDAYKGYNYDNELIKPNIVFQLDYYDDIGYFDNYTLSFSNGKW